MAAALLRELPPRSTSGSSEEEAEAVVELAVASRAGVGADAGPFRGVRTRRTAPDCTALLRKLSLRPSLRHSHSRITTISAVSRSGRYGPPSSLPLPSLSCSLPLPSERWDRQMTSDSSRAARMTDVGAVGCWARTKAMSVWMVRTKRGKPPSPSLSLSLPLGAPRHLQQLPRAAMARGDGGTDSTSRVPGTHTASSGRVLPPSAGGTGLGLGAG